MSKALDQRSDTGLQELYRFSKLYAFPEYVKKATPAQACSPPEDLPSAAFANVTARQFPCHTKAATWLSYLFFLEKKADLHSKIANWVQQQLDRYVEKWGLAGDVKKLREKHAELYRENPLPDTAYMLVWASDNGQKERHYPLTGPLSVKQAAQWFAEHRYHFVFDDRVTMAEKLLEKAAEFGCGLEEHLDDLLQKQAGRGWHDPKQAAEHIRNRARSAVKVPTEICNRLTKLADAVETAPGRAIDPEHCRELARTIDQFDRMTHLSTKYSSLLPPPEDIVFPATWKVAQAFVDTGCTLTTGSVYNRDDFAKLALSEVRDLFGDDIAQEVADGLVVSPEKMAEVAATLPRGDAQLLDRLLSDNGVTPVVKQAAATLRWSPQELRKLQQINQALTAQS